MLCDSKYVCNSNWCSFNVFYLLFISVILGTLAGALPTSAQSPSEVKAKSGNSFMDCRLFSRVNIFMYVNGYILWLYIFSGVCSSMYFVDLMFQSMPKLVVDDDDDASDGDASVHSDAENDASKTTPVATRMSTRRSNTLS